MKPDFTTWTAAPDYQFARELIDWLKSDKLLAPLVYEEPFDRADQCQQLGTNARSFGGCVMVTPQDIQDEYPEARTRVLRAEMAVTILATNHLSGGTTRMTAGEVLSVIRARVLHLLCGWRPVGRGIAQEEPQLEGCVPLNAAAYKDWQNITGCTIMLSQRMQF